MEEIEPRAFLIVVFGTSHRQRAELDELRKQLEDNCALATRVLREEYEKSKEEQDRRHQVTST